jgi:hypothetical protein
MLGILSDGDLEIVCFNIKAASIILRTIPLHEISRQKHIFSHIDASNHSSDNNDTNYVHCSH